jgi:hypothetical protein
MKSWRVPIFFPNWLGDFAIQDGDCCFPPTRPARSLDRSDPTRTRRTALMEEERIEGSKGLNTRDAVENPEGRLLCVG